VEISASLHLDLESAMEADPNSGNLSVLLSRRATAVNQAMNALEQLWRPIHFIQDGKLVLILNGQGIPAVD
jgi:hypothetical protein